MYTTDRRKALGKRIKEAREKAQMTQDDLVEKLKKKTASSISEYEAGKRSFGADELIEFAEALDVPVSFFFADMISADEDLENQILDLFRKLPTVAAKKRAIIFLEQLKPLIIGE